MRTTRGTNFSFSLLLKSPEMNVSKLIHIVLFTLYIIVGTAFTAHAQDKGTCTAPYATLTIYADYAAADAAYTNLQQTWAPDATGTINTYAIINSGASGSVGFDLSHNVGTGATNSSCVGNAQREIRLFPLSLGACNWATGITYSAADGGNGCTWSNPIFSGLTPNTDYIVQVKTIIPTTDNCAIQAQYLTYYQISLPLTCSTCATANCPATSIIATTVATARTNMTTALNPFTDSYAATLSPGQSQTICVPVTVPVGSTVLGFKQKATSSPSGCANATEEPVTYQLRPASNCSATPIAPSATNASPVSSGFNPEWNNLAPGDYILCYTMSVSASAGCSEVTVDRIGYYNVIPACAPPIITNNPTSSSICSGNNTSFSAAATGGNGFQWQVNTGSGWSNVANGGVYTGTTTATLTLTGATTSLNNAQYRCIIQGSTSGCPDTTSIATLTVTSALTPTYSKTYTDVTCVGPNTGTITFTGISTNTTFNWVSGPITSPIPAGNKPAGATDERALVNIPAGTYCVDITRSSSGIADTTTQILFTEEFETGASAWSIDNSGGSNIFVINNDYLGGTCVSGAGNFVVPNVPNQPVAIPSNPTSSYLHIKATTTTGATCTAASTNFIPNNANFDAQTSDQKVTLNTPIVTTGLTNVKFKFYWIAKGDVSGNDYGAIEYSTNGGTSWIQAGAKLYNKGTSWNNDSVSVATWNNQSNLRFRIRWVNNASSTPDPPLAIDHIVITGDAITLASTCSATVQECFTIESPICCVPPIITSQPLPAAVCNGEDTSFVVSTTGASGYQWQVNTGSGWTNITNGGIYSGATTNTLIISNATGSMNNYLYQCIVLETMNSCPTTSANVSLSVNVSVDPVYSKTNTNETCEGRSDATITITSTGNTFNWISGPITSPIPSANKPIGASDESSLINLSPGTYCVNITNTPSGTPITTTQVLFTEEFETGASAWSIDNSGGSNIFVINNDYLGGTCVSGAGNFVVPNVPNQPVAIPNNPTSSYLHIKATTTTGATCTAASTNFIPNNANFDAQTSDQKVTLNTPIVTTGLTNVKFKFYWIAKGDVSGNDYGAIEYSTNGGTSWAQVGAKLYNKGTTWNNDSVTDASWNNQSNLRFRIRWINNASSTPDPPLAIDHIVITGDLTTATATCPATVQECFTITTTNKTDPIFTQIASFCEGTVAPILPTSSTNTPAITGTWNTTIANSPVGTTTYTFTPTAGLCALSKTMDITVTAPNIAPTFTQVNPFCAGSTPVALPTTSNNTPSITGSWNSPIDSMASATYTFTPANGQCAISTTMNITVKPNPNVSITPFDTSLCLNTTILLTANGADSYNWTPANDLSSSTGSDVTYTATTNGNKVYSVIGITNGCTDSAQVILRVNPLPVITLDADKRSGCEPLTVEFSLITIPVSPNISWNFGNGSTSGVNPSNATYNSSGSYDVTVNVMDINGCVNSYLATDYITVYPTPNVDFTMSPDYANIGESVTFNSSNISSGMIYEWHFGDGFYETSTSSTSHSYLGSGNYTIEHIITSEHGCKDSISKPIEIIRPIRIPNVITPNNDGFNDKLVFEGLEGYPGSTLQLYNRWGRGIYTSEDYKNDWDGENHSDGTYFYILTLNEKYKIPPFHGSLTIIK